MPDHSFTTEGLLEIRERVILDFWHKRVMGFRDIAIVFSLDPVTVADIILSDMRLRSGL